MELRKILNNLKKIISSKFSNNFWNTQNKLFQLPHDLITFFWKFFVNFSHLENLFVIIHCSHYSLLLTTCVILFHIYYFFPTSSLFFCLIPMYSSWLTHSHTSATAVFLPLCLNNTQKSFRIIQYYISNAYSRVLLNCLHSKIHFWTLDDITLRCSISIHWVPIVKWIINCGKDLRWLLIFFCFTNKINCFSLTRHREGHCHDHFFGTRIIVAITTRAVNEHENLLVCECVNGSMHEIKILLTLWLISIGAVREDFLDNIDDGVKK